MTPTAIVALLEQRAREIAQSIAVHGPRGWSGEDGQNGKDGRDGRDGEKGDLGGPGTPGEDGVDGKDGQDGKDGRDGKDADPDLIPKPATSVVAETTFGQRPTVGTTKERYALGDHGHGTPPPPAVGGGGGGGGVHPNLTVHAILGLATQTGLDAHAATSHGETHPDLATHDTLGLATQAELDALIPVYIQDTEPAAGVFLWVNTTDDTLWYHDGVIS